MNDHQKTPDKPQLSRAIITVVGTDQVGIIARVSMFLFEQNINILDISQTILQDFFTMIMVVDLGQAKISFKTLQDMLKTKGDEIGLLINIQHEDIFKFMHRI